VGIISDNNEPDVNKKLSYDISKGAVDTTLEFNQKNGSIND
jgi:hypothetical protein